MTLYVPVNEFQWKLETSSGFPSGGSLGTVVTPGNNTKGSYAELIDGALVTNDAWFVEVIINSNNVTTAARDTIVDIGIDPIAGTSYTVLIPDLLASCAAGFAAMPFCYRFPLHIPAGSSIAARASINNATVGTLAVVVKLWGHPSHPELIAKGCVVEAIGITAASSKGKAVTFGTSAAEGTWTSLGNVTREAWWWQMGMGCNDATMAAVVYMADLSAGGGSGGDRMIIENLMYAASAAEVLSVMSPATDVECRKIVAAGTGMWGRGTCTGTPDSNLSIAAYALS